MPQKNQKLNSILLFSWKDSQKNFFFLQIWLSFFLIKESKDSICQTLYKSCFLRAPEILIRISAMGSWFTGIYFTVKIISQNSWRFTKLWFFSRNLAKKRNHSWSLPYRIDGITVYILFLTLSLYGLSLTNDFIVSFVNNRTQ